MALFKKNTGGKKETATNELDREKEKFAGFVLLSEPKWSKTQFAADMKEEWGIDLSNGLGGDNDALPSENSIIYAEYNGMRVITGLVDAPIPAREAEHFAMANYMWKDAVSETEKHAAHLIITVMGDGEPMEKAKLYVKAASAALKQSAVLGFYSNGAVYEPRMFRDCAEMMRSGDIPIMNIVWFGLFNDGKQAGVYTYGMRQFGKEEIEVYVPTDKADLNSLRQFVFGTALYVLNENVTLRDGETIGFSAEQKLPITISPALAYSGNSIKIDILAK